MDFDFLKDLSVDQQAAVAKLGSKFIAHVDALEKEKEKLEADAIKLKDKAALDQLDGYYEALEEVRVILYEVAKVLSHRRGA